MKIKTEKKKEEKKENQTKMLRPWDLDSSHITGSLIGLDPKTGLSWGCWLMELSGCSHSEEPPRTRRVSCAWKAPPPQ